MDSTARLSRIIALVLLCALVVGAAACGGEKPKPPSPPAVEPEAALTAPPSPPAPLPPPPPPPYPPGVPYEEAFPEDFKGIPPVRIGVLSSANRPGVGQRIALLLGVQRRNLERKLHKPVKVAFVSRSRKRHEPRTQIRYRPKFLEAAIQVAGVIASKQNVRPMSQAELAHKQVDIFVYVGSGER